MNKKSYVRKQVGEDVWQMFKSTYKVYADEPTSDMQRELLAKIADYIYDKFATQISKTRLEDIFKKDSDDQADKRRDDKNPV
jgi:hypothetical protein